MKVVLRENVDNLGRRGDVVNVAAGYGRNYLIPKKLAYPDTAGFQKQLQAERRVKDARELREKQAAEAVAERVTAMSLSITKKVGEEGHLYGSVTSAEIAELLGGHGLEVDKRRIEIAEPIRTVGTHTVPVKLHREVMAQVTVEVVAEATEAEAPAASAVPSDESPGGGDDTASSPQGSARDEAGEAERNPGEGSTEAPPAE